MTIAHVASAIAGASSPLNTVTTAGVNASGANFSVIGASWYNAGGLGSFTVSDSNANVYTPLTQQIGNTVQYARLWYSQGGVYGSGMTFTAAGDVTCFPSVYGAAFSGVHASPFDAENGNTTSSATSLSCGSVTPSEDNCLIVAFGGLYTASGISIDQGFTALTQNYGAGTNLAAGGGYLIETAAAAKNPTWSWTTAERAAAVIAVFKGPGTLSPVTATPGVAALSLTRFAPAVSTPRLATPGVRALALTRYAPAALAPRLATPGRGSLTLATFAPTASAPRVATPGVRALTLAAFAPTVTVPLAPTPGVLALAATTFAPSVATPRIATPGAAGLTLTSLAPAVATPRLVTPAASALSVTVFAPTAAVAPLAPPAATHPPLFWAAPGRAAHWAAPARAISWAAPARLLSWSEVPS